MIRSGRGNDLSVIDCVITLSLFLTLPHREITIEISLCWRNYFLEKSYQVLPFGVDQLKPVTLVRVASW